MKAGYNQSPTVYCGVPGRILVRYRVGYAASGKPATASIAIWAKRKKSSRLREIGYVQWSRARSTTYRPRTTRRSPASASEKKGELDPFANGGAGVTSQGAGLGRGPLLRGPPPLALRRPTHPAGSKGRMPNQRASARAARPAIREIRSAGGRVVEKAPTEPAV